jgi:hypothetical protein
MAKTYKGAPCETCGGDIRTKGGGDKCAVCYPPPKEMGNTEAVERRHRIEDHQEKWRDTF